MKTLFTKTLLFMLMSIGTNAIAMEQKSTEPVTTKTPDYDLSKIDEKFRSLMAERIDNGMMDPSAIPVILKKQKSDPISKWGHTAIFNTAVRYLEFSDGSYLVFYDCNTGKINNPVISRKLN